MKTLLPIPGWWGFLIEGQRVPWDATAIYSEQWIFATAFRCYLRRDSFNKTTIEDCLAVINESLPVDDLAVEKESIATTILLKWGELVDFFSDFGTDLRTNNVKVFDNQPFEDVILVDLPESSISKDCTARVINLRKPPIDLQ